MIPSFAVVGRTNKGKSSIVATLSENEEVAIANTPRTTQSSHAFTFKVDGEALFTIYDTPGFEEAPAALEWLKAVPVAAHERLARVQAFVDTFHGTERFRFECELLKPVLEGAAILYVVDSSHPFRSNFEAEFEILQWTGAPSIALLNQIGESTYEGEWRRALQQYFKKVKTFNAHTAWIHDRLTLLEELRVLSDSDALLHSIEALRRQNRRRIEESARVISQLVLDCLRYESKLSAGESYQEQKHLEDFFNGLRQLEAKARDRIAALYAYKKLGVSELSSKDALPGEGDLFSKETWEIFGLTRSGLIFTGTAAGALTGGGLDAMVGGASFMMGTSLGALLGGASSAYLAYSDPKIGGFRLGRKKRTIGPYKNPNFPWILIDREFAFLSAIWQRTHAQRGTLNLGDAKDGKLGLTSRLSRSEVNRLAWIFQRARWNLPREALIESLADELKDIFLQAQNAPANAGANLSSKAGREKEDESKDKEGRLLSPR